MTDHAKHVEAVGGAEAKTGDNRRALSRPAGYMATMSACSSKTRSRHTGSSVNNLWQSAPSGYGSNENIKGYGH